MSRAEQLDNERRDLDDYERAEIRREYTRTRSLLGTAARYRLTATRTARICRINLDGTPRSPHADDGGW